MSFARISKVLALAVVCCGFAAADASSAIQSEVTIRYKRSKGLYGFVLSPHPKRCTKDRFVRVFKQRGGKQNRRRDTNIANFLPDKAADGNYEWGPLGRPHYRVTKGDYYARMRKSRGCGRDASRTIDVKHPQPRSA
jgi:hypothetical protein